MALKDWKKLTNDTTWYRKDDKYSYVRLWKTGLPLKEMKRRGHNGTYIVGTRIGLGGDYNKRYFKTKPQALKYARSYMRKH